MGIEIEIGKLMDNPERVSKRVTLQDLETLKH